MYIFGRRRKTEKPELTLVQMQGSKKYDFFSALAKALLLFLLTYGALGGFLSAMEIEYNNSICMLAFLVLALFLSVLYETHKRWITNLTSIMYFLLYLYFSASRYQLISNGYYTIINHLYEVSRQYLNVTDGMEYSLSVEDAYLTVTMFVLFLGMVEIILLNIALQNKSSLITVTILTLPPYVIPFYFERSPDLIYILFLLMGYVTVAILRGEKIQEKLSKQMRYVLPLTTVLTILLVSIISFLLPENAYSRIVAKNARKKASEENVVQFAQYGLAALFRRQSVGTGVSDGLLSKAAYVLPRYETVLKVRYTPYDFQPVYLKAFTGKVYLGDRWTQAMDWEPDDGLMYESVRSRIKSYYGLAERELYGKGELQGRGILEVEKLDDNDLYEYQPYYTDIGLTETQGNVSVYTYYPAVSRSYEVSGEAADAYLDVPRSCRNAVRRVCEEANFSGTEEEIAAQIVRYFDENYAYTLRPGMYLGDPDYITHFLLESKKGYCAHFASAATMLFRQMGIPARYAGGYAFSYLDIVEGGTLVDDAAYSDYYDGYAPLGETALVEIEIPDSYAHAWVEIYVEDKGWIVVDPTPARVTEEDTTSFWDAFMTGGGNGLNLEMPENNLGAYLEGALSSMIYILPGAAALFLAGLCAVHFRRVYREKKLSGRERVQLEYGRLQARLGRKHRDFLRLKTLREQLDWIREKGQQEVSEELVEALYQVYFAEHVGCDCEEVCGVLRRLRGAVR